MQELIRHTQSTLNVKISGKRLKPMEALARLLSVMDPSGAYSIPCRGACFPSGMSSAASSLSRRAQLDHSLHMQSAEELDWREMRARLVQREREEEDEGSGNGTQSKSDSGFVFESPLIEQGTVILGGTKQEFGFAIRQQYFHKSVMLLFEHNDENTKGIILNRPSAYEMDGWRVWFGGPVEEGTLFRDSEEIQGEQEIMCICLHALDNEMAENFSVPIIKGVSYTTLQFAQVMVLEGKAKKDRLLGLCGLRWMVPDAAAGRGRSQVVVPCIR